MAQELDAAIDQLNAGFLSLKGIGNIAQGSASSADEILFDEWDWEVGVGLYGLFRDAEARSSGPMREKLGRWYDRQIARGLPDRQVNSTAPMLTLACLNETEQRADWAALCDAWATWLVDELPKTDEGGFEHVVKEGRRPGQLWDDTLFMAVLFLAQCGKMNDRADWVAEAQYQFLVHLRFLADPASGLFFHGWTFEGRHNYARALWARGNAWLTIAIPELFVIARPTDPALARHLTAVLTTQVEALGRLQNEDGMFHTLLDDRSSPVEASATAGIGYGILSGVRQGLLPASSLKIAEDALSALLSRIGSDGILQDVSDGTAMGHDLDHYRLIKNTATPYGQALGNLFLCEARRQGFVSEEQ